MKSKTNFPFAISTILVVVCQLSLTPSHAAEENVMQITLQTAPIIYETKAELPTPLERIASQISQDYRNLDDEFSKHEYLERLKPVIEKRIAEAEKVTEFRVVVGSDLDEYDFTRKAFPTGISPQTFIPMGDYAVQFTNPEAAAFVPVPLEQAKKLSTALKSSRSCSITYTGTFVKCSEGQINYSNVKILYLKVTKITIQLNSSGAEFSSEIGKQAG